MSSINKVSAVVVGGGFYGAAIAIYLAKTAGLNSVVLIEQSAELLLHASHNNQARVHNGYHYPRSFTTAYRSRVNLPHFVKDWSETISTDFEKIYAIARRNSKVSSAQFLRFCDSIGAVARPSGDKVCSLFNPHLIESVFTVEEYAFNTRLVAAKAKKELEQLGVKLLFNTKTVSISKSASSGLSVVSRTQDATQRLDCEFVFNCTYSGLNQLQGEFPGIQTLLKHEITEMALIQMPPPLREMGVTVMDGAFFSTMPFPSRKLHTLSHVRYTPHLAWTDAPGIDPYEKLANYPKVSRADRMIRDSSRYIPSLSSAQHVDSLYEVKTILTKNETDDGRPILFEEAASLPGCFSILGGKIDNIYDCYEKLDKMDKLHAPK